MNETHQHVTIACRVHHHTLGGCKCMSTLAEASRTELIDCVPHCPGHMKPAYYAEESPAPTWDDIYMGERDVP